MSHGRKNEWSPDQEAFLARTVLHYIENDGTQLAAFEECGHKLGRTAAACGFQWNSTVRKQFTEQIREAKMKRIAGRTRVSSTVTNVQLIQPDKELYTQTADQIIKLVHNLKLSISNMEEEIHDLREKLHGAERENEQLRETLRDGQLKGDDDFKKLMELLSRARDLGLTNKSS